MQLKFDKTYFFCVTRSICVPKTEITWVIGLCCAVEQTNVNTAKMDDVVQSCYHQSPYGNDQSHHHVDHKQQVRQEEQTLSESRHKISQKA